MKIKNQIYLDNNSTTPLSPFVKEKVVDFMNNHFENPSSLSYPGGWYVAELIKIAREEVANLLNALPEEIYFTSGATESNNLALTVLEGGKLKSNQPEVITTQVEHRSILEPLFKYRDIAKINFIGTEADGCVNLEELSNLLNSNTKLVSISLANNEIGSINKLKRISKIIQDHYQSQSDTTPPIFHSDITQALGKMRVDLNELGLDLASFSAHKLYALKGCGALWIKKKNSLNENTRDLKSLIKPLIVGGGQEDGIRAGTLNTVGIIGLGKACLELSNSLEKDISYLKSLSLYLHKQISEIKNIKLNGPEIEKRLPGNLNYALPIDTSAKLFNLIRTKIAFSSGSACSTGKLSHVLLALDPTGDIAKRSIRIGIGRYNSHEEINTAVSIIKDAISKILNNN